MFSGIITDIGEVRHVERDGDTRFVIATGAPVDDIAIGASIACAGVCLTVIATGRGAAAGEEGAGWFAISASAETLAKTTLGGWRPGTRVNLERALKVGDELGGHLVSGHVDATGRILAITADGASRRLVIGAPAELARFFAAKGSVAVDGVSLTVNTVCGPDFTLNIIPHTLAATTLGAATVGDAVNLEIDLIARYVARLLDVPGTGTAAGDG